MTLHNPKTAALIFDKVYTVVDGEIPIELMTYRRGNSIVSFPGYCPGGPEESQRQIVIQFRERPGGIPVGITSSSRDSLIYALRTKPDELCTKIADETGYRPVLCYPRILEQAEPFQSGDYVFVVACLKNLGVVDEERLEWRQVLEFRQDEHSRVHLSRLMNWLDQDMVGKGQNEIQDRLCELLYTQQSVLKRWGMYAKTVGQALLATPTKRLAAIGAGGVALDLASQSPLWSMLAGGLPIANTVVAQVRAIHCQLRREQDALAFFYGAIDATRSENTSSDWGW